MHRAQDILHDAFVRYALSGHHGRLAVPHAYLHTIVRTVLADHVREQVRCPPARRPRRRPTPDGAGGPFGRVSAGRLTAVQTIIHGLPPRCREVFWLCRIEGLTQPEIATHLDISLNTVERHLMRALLDLRALRERLFS